MGFAMGCVLAVDRCKHSLVFYRQFCGSCCFPHRFVDLIVFINGVDVYKFILVMVI